MDSRAKKEAAQEAMILAKINNTYVTKYYDSYMTQESINIVMEYCENGDLGGYLKK